jgi:hypothetical protein
LPLDRVSNTSSVFRSSSLALLGGNSKGVIKNRLFHGFSGWLLLLAVRDGYDMGVGGCLEILFSFMKDWFGVLAGHLEGLDLLLLFLFVVHIDLEGSFVHGFGLFRQLLEVLCLLKQAFSRVEFLLLYAEGDFFLESLLDFIDWLFFLPFSLRINFFEGLPLFEREERRNVSSHLIFPDSLTNFVTLFLQCFELAESKIESG